MDTSTLGGPTTNAPADSDGTDRDTVPEPDTGSGWLVLRNCALGGGGPRVGLVLLHPRIGVALVDFVPKATDAAARLRRALDARRFPAIFGGYPPVARAILPADRLPDLGRALSAEFKAQAPLALAGGDAWVRSARAAIEAENPVAVPETLRTRRRGAFPWRATALAAAVGGLVGLVMTTLALPDRGPGPPASPAVLAGAAPGADSRSPQETAPGDRDLTEQDVLSALASAEAAAGVGRESATEPQASEAAPAAVAALGGERSGPLPAPASLDIGPAHQPRHTPPEETSPAAAIGAEQQRQPVGAGMEAAATPPEPDRAPALMAAVGGDLPEPPPMPFVSTDASAHQPRPAPSGKAPLDVPGAADARPAPKRAAAPAQAPHRPATQAVATGGRPAALPAAPAGDAGSGGRCGAILARATVGGALSDDDRDQLRRGCQPRS